MTKYIDKAALVAEIERRLEELNPKKGEFMGRPLRNVNPKTFPRESELEKLLSFIKTLEVKDADLDKEFDNYAKNILACDVQFEPFTHLYNCAKYFFELGMQVSNKTQKGE